MKKCWIIFTFLLIGLSSNGQPISLHPDNPHYFIYQGKPTLLITSGEHYGAVINSSLNYKKYLGVLQQSHLNLTRIFSGSYYEGKYEDAPRNTLAIRPERLLVPWARSNVPGYINGGNKFDLNKWDNSYFERLKNFCKEASEKGIVVEIVFFSANYSTSNWKNSPLNRHNNINLEEDVPYNGIFLSSNKELVHYQMAMVQKIVEEVNVFDNVYFEICNEPYWLKGIPEVDSSIHEQQVTPEIYEWQKKIALTVKETEQKLPKKHLIAQNFANTYLKIKNLDSNVSILNFHYAYPPKTVTDNYSLNKPIAFDETFEGLNAAERRKEAWAFTMTDGAVYDNLDWSFTNDDMSGKGLHIKGKYKPGQPVKRQLEILQHTLENFDIINARPLDSTYKINGIEIYGLGIRKKDYLVYLLKTKVNPSPAWNMALPDGKYRVKWMNPSNGNTTGDSVIQVRQNHVILKLPSFSEDRVLRIKRL